MFVKHSDTNIMVGRQSNKKKRVNLKDYVNVETGETLESEFGTVTSFNTKDEDFVIIDGENFVIVEKGALAYLESVLSKRELDYVRAMTTLVRGEYNVLCNHSQEPLTRKTMQEELEVAKTTFVNLMSKLHKEGVIAYLDTYISRNKKVKYVVLNPTLARNSKRIHRDTARLFRDLRKGNI